MCAPLIAVGIMAAGALIAGQQQKKASDKEAKQYEEQADQQQQALSIRTDDRKRKMASDIADQQSAVAGAGFRQNGLGDQFMYDTTNAYNREQYEDQFNTDNNIESLHNSASAAKTAGKDAQTNSLFSAASSVGKYSAS